MELIRRRAFARAGLIGNPSDGFHGKTISLIVRNFWAEVVLYEWPTVEVMWSQEDQSRFNTVRDLSHDVRLHGYYGGVRLVKATIKRFVDYCDDQSLPLHDRNFSIRYETNIPRQVGLAGSSAIIVATLRVLMEFYEVEIPKIVQPSLALSVETGELGISAGLQDRVIQVYEGLVFMDFGEDQMTVMHGLSCGRYEPLDANLLPPLFIAYGSDVGEPTEVVHAPLRARFDRGDPDVVAAMRDFAQLADAARDSLQRRDAAGLHGLINQNFAKRREICNLSPRHLEMVQVAQATGASAKFAGSGGAIIGSYRDEEQFSALREELSRIGCAVFKPCVVD